MLMRDRFRVVWEDGDRSQRTREPTVSAHEHLLSEYRTTSTQVFLLFSKVYMLGYLSIKFLTASRPY